MHDETSCLVLEHLILSQQLRKRNSFELNGLCLIISAMIVSGNSSANNACESEAVGASTDPAADSIPRKKPGPPKGSPKPEGSGRRKGSINRSTAEIRRYITNNAKAVETICKIARGKMAIPGLDQAAALRMCFAKIVPDIREDTISGPNGGPIQTQELTEAAKSNAEILGELMRGGAESPQEPQEPAPTPETPAHRPSDIRPLLTLLDGSTPQSVPEPQSEFPHLPPTVTHKKIWNGGEWLHHFTFPSPSGFATYGPADRKNAEEWASNPVNWGAA